MSNDSSNSDSFEHLETDEEKVQWMMSEYQTLSQVDETDGLDFAGKTSMWVAYERYLESKQSEPLFCDPLALAFSGDYGKRLSTAMKVGLKVVFDPNNDIGLGYEGHVAYTAARTQLINDQIAAWIDGENTAGGPCETQIVNLGAGMDSRVFWLDSLRKAALYMEVDASSVVQAKKQIEEELQAREELPQLLCQRSIVETDLSLASLESVLLNNNDTGFQPNRATFWILEGLVMYLPREAVDRLLDGLSHLSAKGSFATINFSTQSPGSNPDNLDECMLRYGWERVDKLYFGDDGFNYGRYPKEKPSNTSLEFCTYQRK